MNHWYRRLPNTNPVLSMPSTAHKYDSQPFFPVIFLRFSFSFERFAFYFHLPVDIILSFDWLKTKTKNERSRQRSSLETLTGKKGRRRERARDLIKIQKNYSFLWMHFDRILKRFRFLKKMKKRKKKRRGRRSLMNIPKRMMLRN